MFTWNSGIWMLRIQTRRLKLWIPMPVFVLLDLLDAWRDLLDLILPCLGWEGFMRELRGAFQALNAPDSEPLFDIRTEELSISLRRLVLGGNENERDYI